MGIPTGFVAAESAYDSKLPTPALQRTHTEEIFINFVKALYLLRSEIDECVLVLKEMVLTQGKTSVQEL